MIAISDLLLNLHIVLLLSLLGVASVLLLVTVTNRLRLRHTLMSWRSGPFRGLPVGPVVFVALVLAGAVAALATGRPMGAAMLGGYLAAGVFWAVSAYLARSIVVTEYGLITNINCSDHAVAWGQVVDYFTVQRQANYGYVFLYVDPNGRRRRLVIWVPPAHRASFRGLVARKLDPRFDPVISHPTGRKALER